MVGANFQFALGKINDFLIFKFYEYLQIFLFLFNLSIFI